jgi:hypothetical protein
MDVHVDTEYGDSPKYSDFTLALGCVFISILITGGTVITARLIMTLIGWR